MADLNTFIEWYRSGDETDYVKLMKVFKSTRNFLSFLIKNNKVDYIDPTTISSNEFDHDSTLFDFLIENNLIDFDDFSRLYDEIDESTKNQLLLYYIDTNYEDAMEFITKNLLSDVNIRQDGFYLHLRDREELEILFCGSQRGESARYVAKLILSEDGLGHDWYFDNTVQPHQVVDELDDKNITTLKDIIFKEIGDVELSLDDYDSDFFSELSEEQGTEGYFRIRAEDLNGLVSDESAFNELCKNDLDELGSNLRSLYWSSENRAYEDELYELVYGGLEEYFEGRISEVPREVTRTDGSKVTRYDSYIKIRNFKNLVETFLENWKGSAYSDSFLEYYGGLTELMVAMINNDDIECIDFRVPEYPDWNRTRKNINELFYDYV